jgi:hypothetical protein
MSIYVEILVRAPMDALWTHTQTPPLHEQWDLRFSRIEYLPRENDAAPQRFRYTTRIGFGLAVSGAGETIGRRDLTDGSRSSALRFGSEEPWSIIREGSGYWKYIPAPGGVRFLTWYDYRTRFGPAGALFDRVLFRPLLGWATAWSFDRLRLWLENRLQPDQALRNMLVHTVTRVALAAIFAYQGLVPKLLARHADEMAMLGEAGVPQTMIGPVLTVVGLSEVAVAAALLVAWIRRWPAVLCLLGMAAATLAVGLHSPRFFEAAFNPFALNVAVASLAAIDLLVLDGVPSAARCRRRPSQERR